MKLRNIYKALFLIHALIFSFSINAESEQALASEGFALYEAKKYEEAIRVLSQLITLKPEHAAYHHTLAKSYGRQAEQANWFTAMNYAKKTKEHLETAVKLEPNNVQFLDDLMNYYREAPAFLGGDKKKAEQIRERIENLLSHNQDVQHYSGNNSNNLDNHLNLHRK